MKKMTQTTTNFTGFFKADLSLNEDAITNEELTEEEKIADALEDFDNDKVVKNEGQAKILEMVNSMIIDKLKQGVNPWRKPWTCDGDCCAKNYVSNKAYSGINAVILDAGYYMTFKEVTERGGKVKKGAKAYPIIFTSKKRYYYTEESTNAETGEVVKETKYRDGFILRYYNVFRLEDTEGVKPIKNRIIEEAPVKTNEEIDAIIQDYAKRSKLRLNITKSDRAYYAPLLHSVTVPQRNQFSCDSEYYSTLFHELTHSTGHSTLLNRFSAEDGGFGSKSYSFEELVAEVGASYCCNYTGIADNSSNENSVAYLKGWAERLENNKASYYIMKATTKATEAFRLIMNIVSKKAENKENTGDAE